MSRQSQMHAGTSDWLLGALKQNPEGLLLLAAGVALLLRKGSTSASPAFAQTSADAKDATAGRTRVAQAAADAKDYAADVAGRTMEKAGSLASSASAVADDARRAVGEQSERLVQQAQSTLQGTMNRVLKEQPLFVAVAGLAAGAAVAAAFPATDFEKQNLGPIGEQVSDAAGRIGEQLKEATAKAGETLKSAAEARGLNPDGLKEVATEVADAFTGSVGGGADQKAGAATRSDASGTSTRSGPSGRSA